MHLSTRRFMRLKSRSLDTVKSIVLFGVFLLFTGTALAQGVTTAAMNGYVTDENGDPLPGANVVAVHVPSGTSYGTATRLEGNYNLPNMKIGGPYTVTISFIGFTDKTQNDVYLRLGQNLRLDFQLAEAAVELEGLTVTAEQDDVLNSSRTGAATYINPEQVAQLPSIKRSTRDLTRLDPRSDGNFSFGGRNWLYNNVSVDGSYFNNAFGLDDPAPGGQANAEPVPFESVEQVQVSIAPFDIREGGFTGANINTVTKSGTNQFRGTLYGFGRNESLLGNEVGGQKVVANPDLSFLQTGFSISGPIIKDKLFFFVNGEVERRDDPGTNFAASRSGSSGFGVSRVDASVMDQISQRMKDVYGYETGPYEGFVHKTDNDKLLAKIDWNINDNNNLTFRYNYLDAVRDLGPHPFVLSFANTGRGPNDTSLPFQNAGYAINNNLHSFALELNTRSSTFANRFFASYNRFRDHRAPFSVDFPTVDIGEGGVTYTTLGHEPFSIHNILDQDVLQFTNNFSYFKGNHVLTAGVNFEMFTFFNSFNIFRHGVFFLPQFIPVGSTFGSLDEFFDATDPNSENFKDFASMVTPSSSPFKGENIETGQLAFYVQDEFVVSPQFNITAGLRVDIPMYFTKPVDNPFSRGLTALDGDGNPETVDQSKLPDAKPLWSPRIGFNWDVTGNRSTQVRGGTGIFTGRIPFVWIGNVISNPGANPNLFPGIANPPADHQTSDDSILQQSFDLNAMVSDFKWPQVWTTNLAIDQQLPWGLLGTLEFIYTKDINAIIMRNADLIPAQRTLADGRPYYTDSNGNNELNPDGGAGIYVIDNTDEGYSTSITAQLRKSFLFGLDVNVGYTFMEAKNQLKSTEIASVLWQNQPVRGNPNKPELSYSEFGHRHRIVGGAIYTKAWSPRTATHLGLVFEAAEGNRFTVAGGNRYSFIYSGDVNGDGQGGNDMIYIPASQNEINLDPITDGDGNVVKTADQQWAELDAFIKQDNYLSENRGKIADRFGGVNPWYTNLDLRFMQDIIFDAGGRRHTVQFSMDILNLGNLFNSDWGVRQVASAAATSPLLLTRFNEQGEPVFNFNGVEKTYINDPGVFSRWQIQFGLKYIFN